VPVRSVTDAIVSHWATRAILLFAIHMPLAPCSAGLYLKLLHMGRSCVMLKHTLTIVTTCC
jgi:hypothetical protein